MCISTGMYSVVQVSTCMYIHFPISLMERLTKTTENISNIPSVPTGRGGG
jgi:hypothetical protein